MGRAQGVRPRVTAEQEALLASLVEETVGALSRRDQLLYIPAFDEVSARFNSGAGLELTQHDIWRLVAKLAK